MISISDNTAADHLIDHLGRETIEANIATVAPQSAARNVPFLSTADMARLKFVRPELGSEYLTLGSIEATPPVLGDPFRPGSLSVGRSCTP